MLILARKVGERIFIGHDIVIEVTELNSHRVKFGIQAPPEVKVYREEIYNRIYPENPPSEKSA